MKLVKEHLKILKCFFYKDYSIEEVSDILGISQHKIRRHLKELFDYYNVDSATRFMNKNHDMLNII